MDEPYKAQRSSHGTLVSSPGEGGEGGDRVSKQRATRDTIIRNDRKGTTRRWRGEGGGREGEGGWRGEYVRRAMVVPFGIRVLTRLGAKR